MLFFSFLLAGIIIFITPLFDITRDPFLEGLAGYFFCYLIASRFFAFLLSKASILTVTLLALERWFSVIKPFTYKVFFTRKKLLKYIACVFALSFLVQIYKFFQIEFKNNTCQSVPSRYGKVGQQAFLISYVIVTFVIPTFITWSSFIHIWHRIKTSPSLCGLTEQAQAQQKLLLRMCAITAAVLSVCWLPNQIVYISSSFGLVQVESKANKFSLILSMSNSIVNPWIYFLSNKEYRKEFFSLHLICKKTALVSPGKAVRETVTQLEQECGVNKP